MTTFGVVKIKQGFVRGKRESNKKLSSLGG